ncbi:DNA polymerase I [bacterium HR33]|nr:DNA polymerase I [bacterium HR33]
MPAEGAKSDVAPAEERLFLIDGYGLIYRAFYAMIGRPLRTSKGENTSAVYAVTQFLLRLLERFRPRYIAWIHDAGSSYREDYFPDYKATREKLEPELQADFDRSVERIQELLKAFRIPLIEVQGYEADDVMGTLASKASERGIPVVLVSGDKDLCQLVSDRVSILNPGRGGPAAVEEQWIDRTNASERLGVPPERVVDYLALVGDASDNIPGVKGIGDKTARELISRFGDLDAILENAPRLEGKRAREALLAGAEAARLSRELATIRRDVPVELDLNALRLGEPDWEAVRRLFTELEFRELLQKLDLGRVARSELRTRVVTRWEEVPEVVERLSRCKLAAVATVAAGSDPLSAELVGLSLAVEPGSSWYLVFGPEALPRLDNEELAPFRRWLEDPGALKAGHDLKFDWLVLRNHGVELGGAVYDTMLASFVLDPGRRSHELEVLALELLGLKLEPSEHQRELFAESQRPVPGRDASVILRLKELFDPQLEALALRRLLDEIEMPLVPVLVDMEWRGIAVDVAQLEALSREFGEELERIERAIYAEAGVEFNINSTSQLRHVLFEKLNLPVIKKTKTGPSTDADVLEQLGAMGFTVPALLLEYRELSKLKSTYVDVLPRRVNPRTGRIHTTFHQTGAATGRLSSSDPNLQNIPVRTPRGERIRSCFVPGPGCRMVVADYSQIELRLLAHLSGDEVLIEAFRKGGDIHRETAAILFGVRAEAVTPEMRARAKTINFATIYGQGPFALSRQLGISQAEAKEFIRRYFETFAGVRRFLDSQIEKAREQGYVETLFGRRRYIPELRDSNYGIRAFGERTAMNSPLQGSAADLIKVAMINLHRRLKESGMKAGMMLQVHDELVLESPLDEVEEVTRLVRREMEGAASLSVPLVVDIGVGNNWLDAKR